jgi:hypothetical protein
LETNKKETEIEEAILYCDRFKDIKIEETQWTGGEPTLLPENKFNKLVEVFYFYKKDINLLTNGYNILNLDKKILQKIKTITFDNHGINENHINNCIKFLKSFYRGNVKVWTVKTHLDLRKAMKHPSNKEKMCSRWLKEIKINDYVIYPCCTMPAMMILDNNSIMREELINAGWTLRNKEIIKTILNYQRTLPDYIMNQCLNNCWMPNVDVGQDRKRITLKPNDVLFRKKE